MENNFPGGILTGAQIQHEIEHYNIRIEPYRPECVGINSYDLHIGNKMFVVRKQRPPEGHAGNTVPMYSLKQLHDPWRVSLDISKPVQYDEVEIPPEGVMLYPGELYLIPTEEYMFTIYYESLITGRSSMGRMGIQVHCEAGFGDIGFRGHWTLQVKVTYPTRIYPGARMCQVYFLTPYGEIKRLYEGKYQGDDSGTITACSKSYEDFTKK